MAAVERIRPERFMEERVARLEANVERMQTDVSEVKIDLRRIDVKVDGVKDSLASFRVEMKEAIADLKTVRIADRVWWLLMSGALLGIMGEPSNGSDEARGRKPRSRHLALRSRPQLAGWK